MTIDELNQNVIAGILQALPDGTDQGTISEILDNLRTDYTERLAEIDTTTTNYTKLNENYETLRTVNNKLMLRVPDLSGVFNDKKPPKEENNDLTEEQEFQSLVNDKGELI